MVTQNILNLRLQFHKYTKHLNHYIRKFKRKYYEWYHYLENNFSNVLYLRYNRENSVNNEIIFKDEKEFKERINKINLLRSKIFNFNRYYSF